MATVISEDVARATPRVEPITGRRKRTAPRAAAADARRQIRSDRSRSGLTTPPAIFFPGPGRIRFASKEFFSNPRGSFAREFFERAFIAPEVYQVEIDGPKARAEIWFRTNDAANPSLTKKIAHNLAHGARSALGNQRLALIFPSNFNESNEQLVRLCRYGQRLSTWEVKHEIEGRLRLHNPALFRKRELCDAIERELMNALGVERYFTNDLTSSVLIHYDPRQIQKHQIIAILDDAIRNAKDIGFSGVDLDLPICTVSAGLAITSTFFVPALAPLSAALFFYSAIPSFKNAYHVVFEEKRLGVDLLDTIVVLACLGTNQTFAGTVLAWTLSVARKLVKRTEDHSKKMLLNVFGKQPRFVWLYRDGDEVETPLEKLHVNDIIVVHTGETVPVDGEVADGMAMIDQHALTGESAPAEKVKGDKVFAATIVLAGKIQVAVTSAGEETTSAKLARILNDTA
jgi:hypothetical protein